MHTAGWTGLLYLLCTARFAAGELKQMDQFHYLASSKVYGNATLPCNAKLMLQNVPQTVIRWYKDEKDITVTPRKHRVSMDHGNLKMQKLREYDSGVYACQVGFPGGTEVIWSQVALSVGGKVVPFGQWLEAKMQAQEAIEGSDVDVMLVSYASCGVIGLLWLILILCKCIQFKGLKKKTIAAGKAAKAAEKNKGDAEKSEGNAEKSEGDESSEEDESSSETE
ncbi:uncharacterized protein LOC144877145 [Branchiostoma floridae x Branchiostoma japonicum]